MLGQLCPPSQLVAISVLEALFFHRHGIRSVSVSAFQLRSERVTVRAGDPAAASGVSRPTWVMWAYSLKSMSAVGIASG